MRIPFWLPLRLRSLFTARALDRDMDDELREHLERLAELYAQHGASPAEAMRQARRDFGALDQLKEECRDMRRGYLAPARIMRIGRSVGRRSTRDASPCESDWYGLLSGPRICGTPGRAMLQMPQHMVQR